MEFEFCEWEKWSQRQEIKDLNNPGIYCIAVSEEDLSGKSFTWRNEIKYIGMTNAVGGLRSRLRQFDNTLKGKLQHGGADRFRLKHPTYSEVEKNIYVSVQVFKCDVTSNEPEDLLMMGDVAKHEYTCFAKYVEKFGSLPEFNNKKKSKKYSQNKTE